MEGSWKTWREIRGELALNEDHVDAYRRLTEAVQRLEAIRVREGVDEAVLTEILDALAPELDASGIYAAAVTRYVAALGGRLEVRAAFGPDTVGLPDLI